MGKPHIHAEVIKAWAEGAEVQARKCHSLAENRWGGWCDVENPEWIPHQQYRVKPKPDFNQTMDVYMNKMYKHYPNDFTKQRLMIDNFALLGTMNLTFDGTTGKLKSAEIL